MKRVKKTLNTNFMPYSYVTLKDQQINCWSFKVTLIFFNQMIFIYVPMNFLSVPF